MSRQTDLSQLVAIVASSDDANIAKTLDGVVTDWNRGAEEIFGYSAVDLCMTPLYGTAPIFVRDSASLWREMDHTIDLVQPFWHAVRFASHELSEPCEIE